MRAILGAFILAALTGCGRASDSDFQPYVDWFAAEHMNHTGRAIDVSRVRVYFGKLAEGVAAECTRGYYPTIIVNVGYWDGTWNSHDEGLIFHELGHCLLLREHVVYKSIMYPTGPDALAYPKEREEFLRELFK